MSPAVVGVIGGSGLYQMEGLEDIREVAVKTPFGKPSDKFIKGRLGKTELVFIPRHGRGHRWLPAEVNFRANIFGMKTLGVGRIIAISNVGSLREEIAPGHFVVPDQFIDRTTQRPNTFFGRGIVAHVSFADPFCKDLCARLSDAAAQAGAKVHAKGTYLCMEGPQFSTRAESRLYRSWGADVIGMTNLQEAKLAREAEICFGTLALATDYDCWHPHHDSVTVEQIVAVLVKNAENACNVVREAVAAMPKERACKCGSALGHAILTDRQRIPPATREKLKLILGKHA